MSSLAKAPIGSPSADGSGAMFDQIASRYDRLNRILSLGLDNSWRRAAVAALVLQPGYKILDVATGTGDLAFEIANSCERVAVVGSDPSPNMLAVAEAKRISSKGPGESVQLEIGDAQQLPYEDDAFDGASIAFGIRNVPDRNQGLREMVRVTKPGGRVVVLELSEPGGGLFSSLARFYVHQVVPRVGAILSGSKEYRYLQQSIEAFPPADQFALMMLDAGLRDVSVRSLTFASCHLYVGRVSDEPVASALAGSV